MDPELIRHATTEGLVTFFGIVALIGVGTFAFNASRHWIDWLDDRLGRGAISDDWGLDELDRAVAAHRSRTRAS